MSTSARISRDASRDRAHSTLDASSLFDSDSPWPRKRFVPPGWEVTTAITSHGLKAQEIKVVDDCKCQDHRQRYPEVEAIVQMFFRVCAIILNISVLIIVCILDTNLEQFMTVKVLYGVVGYSLLLNTLELLSLSNPQPTLLIHHLPLFFPAIASTSSPELQPRVPRLPSMYLAICELAGLIAGFWSAFLFLNPIVEHDANRGGCPVATCVTSEEHDMIYGYILEVMVGLVHVGFFLMAFVHWAKRKGPGWLEAWEK
ncbi:uncharacterized protein N0V89_004207 [Didymosphaeria variabile]|uniref:Uncharacterized protein n=1 Tax=Didymosphaeria variabile TaxID=1932322 RepID=A0A9W8XQ46_9PLEO|nr:uncharacterized protein N0V89_004207 [Didymosphaeria variabile]KAJ4356177.1 hypothetical protein N0V89_004207 [Didymosphaeria variabile]